MHSQDPNKSHKEFSSEIQAICAGTSKWHRPNDRLDFERFVFLAWGFREFIFKKHASFAEATFTKGADFWKATFTKGANFWRASFTEGANFLGATFTENANFGFARFTKGALFCEATFIAGADFSMATFIEGADFREGTFTGNANFSFSTFTEGATFVLARFDDAVEFDDVIFGFKDRVVPSIVDFRQVAFLKPELVRFLRTNQEATSGLLARFVNCHLESVQFDAVRWHQHKGRKVLQDELDILQQTKEAPSHEEVAIAYRRLITSFEKARAYDLVEDCTISEFEMKRKNPDRFLFAEWLKSVYERFPLVRTMGEWVSVAGIYRLASLYGTSYQRAMGVLALLLLAFGICFSTIVDIHPSPTRGDISICRESNAFEELCGGLMHALEVATLQRTWLYEPVSFRGRIVEIFEQVLIAGQVALLLFALRRRFRR